MRLRRVLVALAVLLLGTSACGDEAEEVPDVVTGIIIDIEGDTIESIESFTLKDGDETYEIVIDPDREYPFALSHLHEHLAGSDPVEVDVEERDGELIAVSIEDA